MRAAISEDLEGVLHRAFMGAREAGHAVLTPEHLALELILEPEVAAYLERCGTDLIAVESRLRAYLERIEAVSDESLETLPSATFQSLMSVAIERTEEDRREFVMVGDILLALLDDRKTIASAAILEATRDTAAFEELRISRSDAARRGAA
jgi:ATP-dependent Clp protease ATP-binding subunit ClpA